MTNDVFNFIQHMRQRRCRVIYGCTVFIALIAAFVIIWNSFPIASDPMWVGVLATIIVIISMTGLISVGSMIIHVFINRRDVPTSVMKHVIDMCDEVTLTELDALIQDNEKLTFEDLFDWAMSHTRQENREDVAEMILSAFCQNERKE